MNTPELMKKNYPWFSELTVRILAVLLICMMFAAYSTYQVRLAPFDDTDNPPSRSGLKSYTDYATGCQYISSDSGGLTLRRGTDGKPMCTKPD